MNKILFHLQTFSSKNNRHFEVRRKRINCSVFCALHSQQKFLSDSLISHFSYLIRLLKAMGSETGLGLKIS